MWYQTWTPFRCVFIRVASMIRSFYSKGIHCFFCFKWFASSRYTVLTFFSVDRVSLAVGSVVWNSWGTCADSLDFEIHVFNSLFLVCFRWASETFLVTLFISSGLWSWWAKFLKSVNPSQDLAWHGRHSCASSISNNRYKLYLHDLDKIRSSYITFFFLN